MSYQHIQLRATGGPEQLQLVEEATLPQPGRGEARVRVLAAGAGFTDTIIRRGNYPGVRKKPPFTPGYDYVGVVDAIGDGVENLRIGQMVADMPVIGGYTQYLVRAADRLVPVPDDLDPALAVCMPLSYLTAWQMLKRVARVRGGERVLIHGASGAVGTALLELGQMLDLQMLGTSQAAKFAVLERYGCIPIDYRNDDFVAHAQAVGGVDIVLDAIGGAHWTRSMRCLRRGGRLIGYGAHNIARDDDSLPDVLLGFFKLFVWWKLRPDGRRTTFYNIQTRREKRPRDFADDLGELFGLLKDGSLSPLIAGRWPLADAAKIHTRIDAGEFTGKCVLLPFA
ncbi:medium chain dehydrogenase/reductase family protein [Solimonas terrae]|uniref:Zinc-binding dehydrogenase n=1 Tax=Solimonas terrae TaxID=1396819 RepID=A0A6M2BQ40_9GAMM|nr:medium chain dehydrogenase/reductase family protein [Solimonas terrae]NGY04716.1 zinc-binding dehydrogenase [Solimonas terrae]